ncbi:MAG TPA: DUF3667 domain-containing protein [Longimicrobium sp.]|nr:DUF3667 domain-containing protein [Longimicrobium sp.]
MTDIHPPAPPPVAPPPPGSDRGTSEAPRPRSRWWRRSTQTRRTPDRPCLNCGDATLGFFCPNCGQRKVDVRVSLRRMMMEVMDDQLSLNSTLPRTLVALMLRPGHLTREYVQGRIMHYIPPFRLYLVSSLLFFIFLPLVPGMENLNVSVQQAARADSLRIAAEVDSVLLARARVAGRDTTEFVKAVREHSKEKGRGFSMNVGPDPDRVIAPLRPLALRMEETEKRLNAMGPREAVRTLREAFLDNAPTGIFLMMPLFAFILKLLYLRRKRFYVEHFVFALHVHAFAFLLLTAIMLIPLDWVNAVLSTWFMVALYVAMKRVYGQGYLKTLLKYFLLGQAYLFVLVVGVMTTVLLAALSM